MRSIGRASAHAKNEQAAAGSTSVGDEASSLFNASHIQLRDDLSRLGEKILGEAFLVRATAHFRRPPG